MLLVGGVLPELLGTLLYLLSGEVFFGRAEAPAMAESIVDPGRGFISVQSELADGCE